MAFPIPVYLCLLFFSSCAFSQRGLPLDSTPKLGKAFPNIHFGSACKFCFSFTGFIHPPPPWKRLTLAFQTRASVYCQPNGANCREQVSLKREEEAEWRNASVVSHVNESILRSVFVFVRGTLLLICLLKADWVWAAKCSLNDYTSVQAKKYHRV